MTRAPFVLSSSLFFSILLHGTYDSSHIPALASFLVLASCHDLVLAVFHHLVPVPVFSCAQVPVCNIHDTLLSCIFHSLHQSHKRHFHLSQGETTYLFS